MLKKNAAILKIIAILLIVTIILKLCLVFLWPFVVSILLLFIIEPFVAVFKKFGFSRKTSAVLSFIIVSMLIILTGFFLLNYVYTQIISFFHNIPSIIDALPENIKLINEEKMGYKEIITTLEQLLMSYRGKIVETIISTVNGLIYVIIIFVTAMFLSMDLEKIISSGKKIIPLEIFCVVQKVVIKINQIVSVEIKLVLTTTIQTMIGLYILGASNPLTIGLICGILDILPVVGPSLLFIPWVVYELLIGNIALGTGLAFLYILIQIIREILEIKLVGENLRIHPVTAIISLYLGILVFGVWGVVFGPFMIILTKELFNNFYEGRLKILL